MILVCLVQLNFLYQKHEVLSYFDKQQCFDTTNGTCFSNHSGSINRFILGVGASYTYTGGCRSTLYSGNMITILGKHFIFNKSSIDQSSYCVLG